MNARFLLHVLVCSTSALALSSCGMFGSKQERPVASAGTQEFDPFSNSWTTASRVVTPPPAQPNAALAEQAAQAKREDGALNKAGRAMSSTAGAVGRVVKKPLDWLPFGKKDEAAVEEAVPATAAPKTAAQ
jgi:hypothetical protein